MTHSIWIYILIMAAVTFLIRDIPFTLFRKTIKSRFIRSFLYYVPYATLAVMTFPAILKTSESTSAAAIAFGIGLISAWLGAGLFKVAIICCISVFVFSLIL